MQSPEHGNKIFGEQLRNHLRRCLPPQTHAKYLAIQTIADSASRHAPSDRSGYIRAFKHKNKDGNKVFGHRKYIAPSCTAYLHYTILLYNCILHGYID